MIIEHEVDIRADRLPKRRQPFNARLNEFIAFLAEPIRGDLIEWRHFDACAACVDYGAPCGGDGLRRTVFSEPVDVTIKRDAIVDLGTLCQAFRSGYAVGATIKIEQRLGHCTGWRSG